MKLHLCTEEPCPLKDKECADMLNSGFTKSYVDIDMKNKKYARMMGISSVGLIILAHISLFFIQSAEMANIPISLAIVGAGLGFLSLILDGKI